MEGTIDTGRYKRDHPKSSNIKLGCHPKYNIDIQPLPGFSCNTKNTPYEFSYTFEVNIRVLFSVVLGTILHCILNKAVQIWSYTEEYCNSLQ